MNGNFASRWFVGLIVIGVGVTFLLRQMGIVTFSIGELVSIFWPCILIVLGLSQLLSGGWWGAIPLGIGVIFLGNNLAWFDWSIGDVIPYVIPFIIIFAGLRMIFKPRGKRQAPPSEEWQSYKAYGNDAPIPPAPPLHPDPTGIDGDLQDVYGEKKAQQPPTRPPYADEDYSYGPYGQNQGHDEGQGQQPPNYSGPMHGGPKSHKDKSRDNWNWQSGHNKHEQWWNYNGEDTQNRSGFIGDIHMGQDYWELKDLNISHFIGDTVIDLTKAQIPFGETRIAISSFIGDVKVFVPDDFELGVQVVSSAFIGDVKVLGRKEGGIFTNVTTESPGYRDADKKVKLIVSTFIGDTKVTKVG